MKKQYSYLEAEKLIKSKMLNILDIVVSLCEKYNITYWLDGGTLLGAVRHKGYIPWDDDIDIGVIRKDYNKLLKILRKELPKDYILQTSKTDKRHFMNFAKVRDLNSIIISENEGTYKYNGIFIDIFPFDYVSDSAVVNKMINYLIPKLYEYGMYNVRNQRKNMKLIKSFFYLPLLKLPYKLIEKFIFFLSKITQNKQCLFDGLVCPWAIESSKRPVSVYFPLKKLDFEGKKYNVPNNVDYYLRTLYGENYMTPIKKGYLNHISGVIFNKAPQKN